ncbi:MAG: SHOCT domain-containing protein [Verrucomicrobiota bacterium]|jgi:hypothetical protein
MKANRLTCGLALLAAVIVAGCQNPGIVLVSPNTYMLSREDHAGIFGSMSALKAGVIRDANVFAEKQGKVAIPISAKEHGVGILADWASFELTFKVVDKDDPEAHGTNILSSSSLEGGQGWRNLGGKAVLYPAQAATGEPEVKSPTIGQQLIDLQKAKDAGAITDAEYQTQKAKLLGNK